MSTVKNINIQTSASTYDSRNIGAEAEYVDVSRNAEGTIVTDLETETVASTESLAQTLKNIEDLDTVPTQSSIKGITSGAVYTATLADSALSTSSIKPVQNKVITNALNERLKRTVVSEDIETIDSTAVGDYVAGDIFIATNGNVYKVTDTITGGTTTIAIGTNCEVTTLANEVTSLNNDIANEIDARSELGAHNLLPNVLASQEINGITITVNADKTVTLSEGTVTSEIYIDVGDVSVKQGTEYILTGNSADNENCRLWGASNTAFPAKNRLTSVSTTGAKVALADETFTVKLQVAQGYVITAPYTIKPMLRITSDTNVEYQPYAMTNQELTQEVDDEIKTRVELGAHQLLKYTLESLKANNTLGTWNNNAYTINGVTLTLNDDLTITATGTASAEINFIVHSVGAYDVFLKANTSYIASIYDGKGSNSTFKLVTYGRNASAQTTFDIVSLDCDGQKIEHAQTSIGIQFNIRIMSGFNTNGIIFKPFLKFGADQSNEFTPYTMTNRELTQGNQILTNEVDGGWYKGRNLWNDSNVLGTGTETVNLKNPLPAGTYTLSAIVDSSDTDADTCLIYDVSNSATLGQIARSIGNKRVAITFTTANTINEIRFYASSYYTYSDSDTFSFTNIQIEKGESATKYVPYARTNRDLTVNLIKSMTFSGTTSANGNLSLPLGSNHILIGVSAYEDGSVASNVVCLPYKYSASDINYMAGVKVVKEGLSNGELVPAVNTAIVGTMWYIQL